MGRKKKIKINPEDLQDAEKLKRIVLDLQERSEGQGKEINRLKRIIARLEQPKKSEVENGKPNDEKKRPAQEEPEPEPEEKIKPKEKPEPEEEEDSLFI